MVKKLKFSMTNLFAQSDHILSLLNDLCSAGDVEASDIVILWPIRPIMGILPIVVQGVQKI